MNNKHLNKEALLFLGGFYSPLQVVLLADLIIAFSLFLFLFKQGKWCVPSSALLTTTLLSINAELFNTVAILLQDNVVFSLKHYEKQVL